MGRQLYELSHPQKSIWLIEQFNASNNINNIAAWIDLKQNIDDNILEKALNIVMQSNDAFQTRITYMNSEPMQYISEYAYHSIPIIELDDRIGIHDFEYFLSHRNINIIDSPLYECYILKMPNGTSGYAMLLHHLIADAWSMSNIATKVFGIYNILLKDSTNLSIEKQPSYLSYLNEEKQYLVSPRLLKDANFWETLYNSAPNILSLKNGLKKHATEFTRKTFTLDIKSTCLLHDFFDSYKVSPFIFFLSLYSIYLSRYYNINDFIIGSPTLNRCGIAQKNTIGMFIKTLPFRINYKPEVSFIDYIKRMTQDQLKIYKHSKYPYSKIIDYIYSKTNINTNIYDVIFSYQNAKISSDTPYFKTKWIPSGNQVESLMIHINDIDDTNTINIHYDYLTTVFSDSDVNFIHNRILHMIEQVMKNPNVTNKDIEICTKTEINEILYKNASTHYKYKPTTIKAMFERQVRKTPEAMAFTMKTVSLTYSELNKRANYLAFLLKSRGVSHKSIVAIMLNRSPEIIVSILAILKCGATYLPIEPEYPVERITYMLENSSASIIITNTKLQDTLINKNIFNIDNINFYKIPRKLNPRNIGNPNDLAYIMYTSGSTGTPKAVMIRNYSVINFSNAMKKRLNYTPSEYNRVLSVTTMCFDIFVFEVFPTLLHGLHLIMANEEEQKNPAYLSSLIMEKSISKILTTPSRINLLYFDDRYSKCLKLLKEIVLGGEPFPYDLLIKLQNTTNAKIYNLYGPTETTVYSTFKELTSTTDISIGEPIDNTDIYILDKNKKMLPIGAVGEICIGGTGVALGYYKNPDLTKKQFTTDPYTDNNIIYATGDLGLLSHKEEFYCNGRIDSQIKIRGYRVELGDIEFHISTYKDIEKAVVVLKKDSSGEPHLCTYFTAKSSIDIPSLHKYLLAKLPNYMVPSFFLQLEHFPLTPNHKIDKKNLPEPVEFYYMNDEDYVAPQTNLEKIFETVIKEILNLPKISITADLFNYAIDSLSIISIQTKLIPYGITLKTQDFYDYRTIRSITESLSKRELEQNTTINHDSDYLQQINNSAIKHDINNISMYNKKNIDTILLTGCTGYLGIHILNHLIKNTNTKIYCIIRKKSTEECLDRLKHTWSFYFPEAVLDTSRIVIVEGDASKKSFALSSEQFYFLGKEIDTIIHCAALVKYYGNYDDFEAANVTSTSNIADFCMQFNIHMNYISTLGVSGNYLVSHYSDNVIFTENDFYVKQNYEENVYIHSKFMAEKLLYQKMQIGLSSTILRVGNLTGRYSDGFFQQNISDNAFYNILKFLICLKVAPLDMLGQHLEFTPVDLCAESICKLIFYNDIDNKVFHIYNDNRILIDDFISLLNDFDISIDIVSNEEFNKVILSASESNNLKDVLKGIINDLDKRKGLSFVPTVTPSCDITKKYLELLSFQWPIADRKYIEKLLNHMKYRNCI